MENVSVTPARVLAEVRASVAPTISRSTAAAVFDCDPRTVSVGIEEGTIPAIRLGRRVVIPRKKFLALLEEVEPEDD